MRSPQSGRANGAAIELGRCSQEAHAQRTPRTQRAHPGLRGYAAKPQPNGDELKRRCPAGYSEGVEAFTPTGANAMKEFVQRHASSVIGMLSGFDRLLFRGTLRRIANAAGLASFLSYTGVLLKEFGEHSMKLTEQVRNASLAVAENAGRPVQYLVDPSVRKEDVAKDIARRDGIDRGLVCVLSAVEPCWSFEIHRNRAAKKLELQSRRRRCLHLYHYLIHPRLGFLHVRVQTWLPFDVSVCVNGREWLARQMDAAGLGYR